MSSSGNIERIKLVRDYVDAYNARCDAADKSVL
jgi:hypothetical protein